MSQPAVQESLRQLEADATVLHKPPPRTESDSIEQSPSSLPSWTIQGYKVSSKEHYTIPSELTIVASLAIVAENADVRT